MYKNPEKPSTAKVGGHISSAFSMSAISLFECIKNEHGVYRGNDCMKKFCRSLREHAMEITNFNYYFMVSSSSYLVNNLSEKFHNIQCKYGNDDKKCQICWIEFKYCDCFKYKSFKDDLIECKCLCCNENYKKNSIKTLKNHFFNQFKSSKNDNNKFILFLQKGFYLYQ